MSVVTPEARGVLFQSSLHVHGLAALMAKAHHSISTTVGSGVAAAAGCMSVVYGTR